MLGFFSVVIVLDIGIRRSVDREVVEPVGIIGCGVYYGRWRRAKIRWLLFVYPCFILGMRIIQRIEVTFEIQSFTG